MNSKTMQIGLNVFEPDVLRCGSQTVLCTDEGRAVDFVVCHVDVVQHGMEETCRRAEKLAAYFAQSNTELIANYEGPNFRLDMQGPDGYNWEGGEIGCHRLKLPPQHVKALKSAGNLAAIVYDEFEHVIINCNASIRIATKGKVKLPAFPQDKSGDVFAQARLLEKQLHDYVKELQDAGAPVVAGEHVFQALYHMFARCGIIPNFKSQKEAYTTVQFALAAGAALQYGLPLWNCIDSWFMNTHPGHSAKEMSANLLFAYLAGVNRVYVESAVPMEKDGKLTEYGTEFLCFSKQYRDKARAYDISDYKPEIGIIRFDDTYWGQSGFPWKRHLFGNSRLRPKRASKEYLHAFHLITHGETCVNGINWGRMTLWSLRKHRSFSSMNSAAVFDENVRKETLRSLKLCFLCGLMISPETLRDVADLVRENGLMVVTTKRFAPEHIARQVHGACCRIPEAKGCWIIVKDFLFPGLKRMLSPLLGAKNEIRLTFDKQTIRMKISDDGNEFGWNEGSK